VNPNKEEGGGTRPATAFWEVRIMLKKIDRGLDLFLTLCGSLLFFIAMVITAVQVFLRYALNSPLFWAEELARLCFLWMIYIGSILAIRYDKHMVVDILYEALPGWGKRILDKVVLVVVGVFLIVLTKEGYGLVLAEMTSVTPAMQVKVGYVYAIIPLAGLAMLLYLVFPHKSAKTSSLSE